MTTQPFILFIDGQCTICHGLVKFIVKRDTRQLFFFAPLSGKTAVAHLPSTLARQNKTVVLLYAETFLTKSDAIVQVLYQLGGMWRSLGRLISLFKKSIRDTGYDLVAALRYGIFRRSLVCPIIPAEVRDRFLD